MTTFILILLIIVGVIGFYFWRTQKQWSKAGEDGRKKDKGSEKLSIQNVEAGGVIHLNNVGADMEDYDVTILSKHLYQEGKYTWYELEGDNGSQKVWIDVEDDDELEVNISLEKLRIEDLPITKKDLDKMDDEEEGKFVYDGVTFYYQESDKATFYRDGDKSAGEDFYYWDFATQNEDAFISFEKWDSGAIEVYYSEPLKPSQIEVFSLKSEENQ